MTMVHLPGVEVVIERGIPASRPCCCAGVMGMFGGWWELIDIRDRTQDSLRPSQVVMDTLRIPENIILENMYRLSLLKYYDYSVNAIFICAYYNTQAKLFCYGDTSIRDQYGSYKDAHGYILTFCDTGELH